MKTCTKCDIEKDESAFNKSKQSKDGLKYSCKKCEKEYGKEYRQNNKESIKENKKEYYQDNKESIKENKKEYYQENKESIKEYQKEYQKEYRQENKEDIKEYQKEYQQNNKDSIKEYQKEYRQENKEYNKAYRQNNKEKRNEYQKEYQKRRKLNDPQYKIRTTISRAILTHLKSSNSSKNGESCLKYLPYTMKELEDHIEKQFLETNNEWMNWKNWTIYDPATYKEDDKTTWTWHLDHIIPHSTFKYDNMDCQEFKDCWALSNLRPYKAKDNIEDGNRR